MLTVVAVVEGTCREQTLVLFSMQLSFWLIGTAILYCNVCMVVLSSHSFETLDLRIQLKDQL